MTAHARPRARRQISVIVILIVAMATPATLSLSYYHLTGDPTLRPLALTVERLAAGGSDEGLVHVRAMITTDGTQEGAGRSQNLGLKLQKAFYGKGLKAVVNVLPQTGDGPPQIHFIVAGNTIGPFNERTAAHGVQIASEAANIQRNAASAREHSW